MAFSKKNLVSTIITAIWGLMGGFLLWGIIGDSLMTGHILTEGLIKVEPDMFHLAIGCLIQAFAFSAIYGKWGAGEYSPGSGLKFGLWVALMVGLGETLIDYATSNMMDIQGAFLNFGLYIVFFAVTGLLAGFIYKKV